MSSSAQPTSTNTKEAETDEKANESQKTQQQRPAAALEEDDEFEDFPVEGAYSTDLSSLRLGGRYCNDFFFLEFQSNDDG